MGTFHFHGSLKRLSISLVNSILRTRFAYFSCDCPYYKVSPMHALPINLIHCFGRCWWKIEYHILTSHEHICYRAWFSWHFQCRHLNTKHSFSSHFMSSPLATEVTNPVFRLSPPINLMRTRPRRKMLRAHSSTGGTWGLLLAQLLQFLLSFIFR